MRRRGTRFALPWTFHYPHGFFDVDMAVVLKAAEEIERMRVAGRLAAEVLDFIAPHVKRRRHHRRARPPLPRPHGRRAADRPGAAQLRPARATRRTRSRSARRSTTSSATAFRATRMLKPGDIVNVDVTVIKDGFHGDTSRMFYVGEPSIQARRLVDVTYECDVARHPRGAPGRAPRRHRRTRSSARREQRLQRRARVLRPRHRPPVPRGAAGPALRPARAPACELRAGDDLHHRADDQRRQAGDPRARRRLDDRHQGPQPVGAVGAHGARHRVRLRGAHRCRPARRRCRSRSTRHERRAVAAVRRADAVEARRRAADLRQQSSRASARRCARDSEASRDAARLLRRHRAARRRASAEAVARAAPCRATLALVAVGGYGRGELFPHSDVDVLILLPHAPTPARARHASSSSIGTLWDIGLELGHSVRTIEECVDDGRNDVTVQTTLLEARLLAGSRDALRARSTTRIARRARPAGVLQGEAARAAAAPRASYQDSPTTSSPTSRKARAGCATCRPCCGSRARRARPRAGASSRARGAHHARARRASSQRHERLPAASCASACTTSPAGARTACVRPPDRARRASSASRDTPHRARERAADAALLPRRQGRDAGEHHPAAEPAARAILPARDAPPAADQRALPGVRDELLDVRDERPVRARSPRAMLEASCCCSSTPS